MATSCWSTHTMHECATTSGIFTRRPSRDSDACRRSSNGTSTCRRSMSWWPKPIAQIASQEIRVHSLRDLQLRFVAALYEGNDAIVSDHLCDGVPSAAARLGV